LRYEHHQRDHAAADDSADFREDVFAQIGAVAVQKPTVGLMQITFHQALAHAVFAHQRKAGLRVGGERLESQRGDQQRKEQHPESEQELLGGVDADVVANAECGVEYGVGLQQLGVGQHRHERQDRSHTQHIQKRHHKNHAHKHTRALALSVS